MLGVLLESRARRPRRTGGTVLSVAAHMIVIGGAVIAPAHGTTAPPQRTPVVIVHFTPPQPLSTAPRRAAAPSAPRGAPATPLPIPVIAVPAVVAVALPAIEPSQSAPIDQIVLGFASRDASGRDRTLDVGPGTGAETELRGTELIMRILASVKPRYPETLRQAGIGGRVLVRFTVDTTGRVDMASVQVAESTHPLFTAAVRNVLPAFRFKPSEVGGRRAASLAEMPFEFSIAR